jgi:predicted lipid-binding transport protein (Tim44 family)
VTGGARRLLASLMAVLALASFASVPADARRGGSFGSRGARTYQAPRSTYNSGYVPPVQRSMTTRSAYLESASSVAEYAQPNTYRRSGSRFGWFGGGLLTGLVAGGLIGHFFGHGASYGWRGAGGGGLLASLIQIAIIGGIVWLIVGFFRRRSGYQSRPAARGYDFEGSYSPAPEAGPWGASSMADGGAQPSIDIALTSADQQAFEELLIDVQDAFGREDYNRLRTLTTPEMMAYLAEELAGNTSQGVRNEVSGTRLVDAEVSEAWREASGNYATIVMRYESIDVMRDRQTGLVVSGAAHVPTETIEVWTFTRSAGAPWKLSAIQQS